MSAIRKDQDAVEFLRRLFAMGWMKDVARAADELERTREAFANLQHAIEAEGYRVRVSINTPTKFTLEKRQAE